MKTIKYLVMGVVLAGFSTTAMAQDGTKADVDAVKKIISSKPADLDKQMKPFYSKNKKNPENLVAFARAFYEAKDTANAAVYADYALKTNKSYAPAYILKGDLRALADDGGGAAAFYDQAIYFDPKNPEGYRKYASVYRKISPQGAISKLNDLRAQLPDYPVDAVIGHINYISNNFDEAISAYEKVDRSKLEKMDMIEYTTSCYFTQKYDKGLDMAIYGLQKEPRNSTLNRMAMFCNTEKGDYEKALDFADRLFNKSDSANISYMDYVYYGNALNGVKRHDEAIAMFQKALDQEFDNKDKRAGVIQTLANAYKGMEDYPNALKYYEQYLNEVSKASASDYHSFAQLYVKQSNTLEGDAKTEALKKADGIYENMQSKYADIDDFIAFQRARVGLFMDPDFKKGLANPHYTKLIEVLNAKEEKDAADKKKLTEACGYFINYYIHIAPDNAKAKEFAAILLTIDPENEAANAVMQLK
ncbi:MAG: tetratricopeptide repeat protein [Bacteroidaceae bacterium]|nr:tetratricopeptide repeat protein [Bacteroidaceae bacterium]